MKLIQGHRQIVTHDIDNGRHLHDVEVHADVQRLARLDSLTGSALIAIERVVDDARVVLEAGFVLLPEGARVHLSASRLKLFWRNVAAL